jgi:hypothetical protein
MMINIDFLGDDLVSTAQGNNWYNNTYKWIAHRNATDATPRYAYRFYYKLIANANMIISNIDKASGPAADRRLIKGEALCYRAWAHFVLVQLFAKRYDATAMPNQQWGVPLMLINTSEGQPRATVEEVYTQINKDLDSAITNLTSGTARANISHFNANVAQGLKARVALTTQRWDTAAVYAAKARAGFTLMSNAQYLTGFNSIINPEWMWGSAQISDQTTYFYSFFAFMSANFNSTNIRSNPKAINKLLYNQISATDIRKQLWDPTGASIPVPPSGSRYPYINKKFLAISSSSSLGDVPNMRAAEMYLIEAEAKARAGQSAAAADVLYELAVNRDASYVKSVKTGQDLIDEILIQRRVELWGEGFRFLDLKRLNSALDRNGSNHNPTYCVVLSVPAGDKTWQFLIPQDEINANKKMVQNDL